MHDLGHFVVYMSSNEQIIRIIRIKTPAIITANKLDIDESNRRHLQWLMDFKINDYKNLNDE